MSPYLSLAFGGARSGRRFGSQEIVAAIAEQLRDHGASLAGCRLPPIRVLAHRLGVSKNTVSVAYDELKARGLVVSRGKLGLFVQAGPREAAQAKPNGHARVPAPEWSAWPGLAPHVPQRSPMLELGAVFIDPRLLPRERLAACFRAVLKKPGLSDFSDPQGFRPLRRAIAKRLQQRGIEADPDSIVTTIGSQQALDLCVRSLRRRVIGTENPAYHLGKALFERMGAEVVGLPVDPFAGADFDAWQPQLRERRPSLLYLTTHFQNPTGYSYTSLEIERILDWAREFKFGLLEDDWGSDMLSYSEFTPSLRALGGSSVLYMNSFTKKLLPALRIGYVLADPETAAQLIAAKRVSVGGSPALGEAALYEFLEQGYYDQHLRALQPELDRRYQHCLELLRQLMPEGVRWTAPGGGPQLWLEVPRAIDLRELAANMRERKILLSLSDRAFFGAPHLHGCKLGYAFLAPDEMERGLTVLAAELRSALARRTTPAESARMRA